MRVGIGYDAHQLVAGRALVLGGVEVPFEMGLEGWSDADVLVHAVIDALLGAAALGDIGQHFPPGDMDYRGISSLDLLRRSGELVEGDGWHIGNIDATIVARRPALSPYLTEMKRNIGQALALDEGQVGIKASSGNALGFAGRGEGIAACAVALVMRNDEGP